MDQCIVSLSPHAPHCSLLKERHDPSATGAFRGENHDTGIVEHVRQPNEL
jgi:hypothetical protein